MRICFLERMMPAGLGSALPGAVSPVAHPMKTAPVADPPRWGRFVRSWSLNGFFLQTAEIETVDLPAARNSSSRRSSSCVQRLCLFPTMQ
jgi:hypothetical protein